jgi:hypothetical protein
LPLPVSPLIIQNDLNYLVSYFPGWPGLHSRQGRGFVLFAISSRPVLVATQPPIQWIPGPLSPGVNRPGRDHLLPSSAELKNAWSYTSTVPYIFMACCLFKARDFTWPYLNFGCVWKCKTNFTECMKRQTYLTVTPPRCLFVCLSVCLSLWWQVSGLYFLNKGTRRYIHRKLIFCWLLSVARKTGLELNVQFPVRSYMKQLGRSIFLCQISVSSCLP